MDTIIGQQRQAAGAPPAASIVDADQTTFVKRSDRGVAHGSRAGRFLGHLVRPVQALTPTLERVVGAAAGRVKLVKVDVDKNRALVEQLARMGLPMQSIPTVAAFWQGQIADLFQGALPESEVKRFVEQLLKLAGGSMPAADMLAEAQAALDEGQAQEAGELFSAVLGDGAGEPGGLGRPGARPAGAGPAGAGAGGAGAGAGQDRRARRSRRRPQCAGAGRGGAQRRRRADELQRRVAADPATMRPATTWRPR